MENLVKKYDFATAWEDIIHQEVGKDAIFMTETDTVDDVEDYEKVINSLFAITGGEITLEAFASAEKGRVRTLVLKYLGTDNSFKVEGDTDWIDHNRLMKGLNKVLIKLEHPKRFYYFWDANWEHEAGYFYATVEMGEALLKLVRKREDKDIWDMLNDGYRED